MASSSFSQDDIDVDFEKNNRRSRIRTARAARQVSSNSNQGGTSGLSSISSLSNQLSGLSGLAGLDEDFDLNAAAAEYLDANASAINDTSPKPVLRTSKDKRNNKLHHVNKGKQQRDRRKLREKRRSTGVVHLASTESTGGSTTGDDEESSSDVVAASGSNCNTSNSLNSSAAETKRNTQHNESPLLHHKNKSADNVAQVSSLLPPSILRTTSSRARAKSPSDLEADDENDQDSLIQSGSSSNVSSSNHIPGLVSTNLNFSNGKSSSNANQHQQHHAHQAANNVIPGPAAKSKDRVVEENRRLLSLVEEKDRRINLLEHKVQQLMRDTRVISEEQSRLQRENSTLLKALSNITAAKQQEKQ